MKRHNAILLLGPTGAGKTPLGESMAKSGVGSKRCFHFDFGANLRQIADSKHRSGRFNQFDLQIIQEALTQGKLLENESFYIARKILEAFIEEKSVDSQDLLLLNGLPRHIGQARDTDQLVKIGAILSLECTPAIVQARIQKNTGGDRTHRSDDSHEEIKAKLNIFRERTQPVQQHYENQGNSVYQLNVGVNSTPAEIHAEALRKIESLT